MRIRDFIHKGPKGLYLENSSEGVPPDAVDKLRAMLTFLQDMQGVEGLRAFPLWKAHQLTGRGAGPWSLSTSAQTEVCATRLDVNYEDYH